MTPEVEVVGDGPYVHVPAICWMKRDLGIRHRVRILWGEDSDFRTPDVNGSYSFENGVHYIMLRPGRSIMQSAISLSHELVHASQAERKPDFMATYSRELDGGYFYDNRFESECRRRETELALRYHPVR